MGYIFFVTGSKLIRQMNENRVETPDILKHNGNLKNTNYGRFTYENARNLRAQKEK